jgi:pyrroline-5-carboxylate reductase
MLKDKQVGFVGTGNMGEALMKGLLSRRLCLPDGILCSDVRVDRLKVIAEMYGVKTTQNNREVVKQSDIIILAVKPQILKQVVGEMAEQLNPSKLVISIAAGVAMESIEFCAKKDVRLIRVMPNICVSVGEGIAAISANKMATPDDQKVAKAIFDSVGKSLFMEEHLLDAVTGLSGSGPAYVFLIIDALADGGVKMGLTKSDALLLASQTVLGSAKMLMETGEHPGRLKDSVTSPGGTTIEGLHALEDGGVRTTLIRAVEAATQRSKVLGQLMKNSLAKD